MTRQRGFRNPILWIGIVLLVVGSGPLLGAVACSRLQGDPNPNPVGPGMLAMCTFWPSVILIGIGAFAEIVHFMAGRGRRDDDDAADS